jgi:hypothetical protein
MEAREVACAKPRPRRRGAWRRRRGFGAGEIRAGTTDEIKRRLGEFLRRGPAWRAAGTRKGAADMAGAGPAAVGGGGRGFLAESSVVEAPARSRSSISGVGCGRRPRRPGRGRDPQAAGLRKEARCRSSVLVLPRWREDRDWPQSDHFLASNGRRGGSGSPPAHRGLRRAASGARGFRTRVAHTGRGSRGGEGRARRRLGLRRVLLS